MTGGTRKALGVHTQENQATMTSVLRAHGDQRQGEETTAQQAWPSEVQGMKEHSCLEKENVLCSPCGRWRALEGDGEFHSKCS